MTLPSKQQKHVADPNAAHCAKTMANIRGNCSKEPIWQCELNIFYSSDLSQPQFLLLNSTSFISCSQNCCRVPVPAKACVWDVRPPGTKALNLSSLAPLCQNYPEHTLNYIRSKAENYMPSKVER